MEEQFYIVLYRILVFLNKPFQYLGNKLADKINKIKYGVSPKE